MWHPDFNIMEDLKLLQTKLVNYYIKIHVESLFLTFQKI